MKVLILGSDFGTIDLLKEAKRNGDYVIVADYYQTTSTKKLADESVNVSTLDIDAVEQLCKAKDIEAIVMGANDFNVNAGRIVAKRLHLPVYCSNDDAWHLSCNKRLFKNMCKAIGAPIAKDFHVSSQPTRKELDAIQYPVVVKALDQAGNVGFSYCDNEEDLMDAIKKVLSVSDEKDFIVESCLHGPEFVANYVLAEGKAVLNHFCSEHHQPGFPANLYSLINSTTYKLKQYLEEVDGYVVRLFKEAGFSEGVAWVECMLNDDGHFYLLEPGYRFCGEVTFVPYGVISGFNPMRWMLDIAKGAHHRKEELPPPVSELLETVKGTSAVAYHLFGCKEGIVSRIEGLDVVGKIPNVVIDLPHREGYNMRFHKNMGVIRFPAFSRSELETYMHVINDNLRVLDRNGESLIIHYDNIDEVLAQYDEGLEDVNQWKS